MAKHDIETKWMGKMRFDSNLNDHIIVMDAPVKSGGEESGTIPKPLVLAALSGCTGMDVVALLRRKGIELNEFSLNVTGELSKQHPLEYIAIHITYNLKASAAAKDPILQAISDSQEKYCGVSHMLKKALPVTWSVVFNDETVYDNQHAVLAS